MEWWNADRAATSPSSSVIVTQTVLSFVRRSQPAPTEPWM